ncbi:hypothetical protein RR46_08759 [Papilio xuthus]|uniref:Uncharacterized protein n=1 Tax=Papilio xuthus TaxID=66420 RepID=A0A194PVZ3_PAPXU|nr:hypothetical protein RR46_08759 [Papilio xuthus]
MRRSVRGNVAVCGLSPAEAIKLGTEARLLVPGMKKSSGSVPPSCNMMLKARVRTCLSPLPAPRSTAPVQSTLLLGRGGVGVRAVRGGGGGGDEKPNETRIPYCDEGEVGAAELWARGAVGAVVLWARGAVGAWGWGRGGAVGDAPRTSPDTNVHCIEATRLTD